MTVSFIMVSWCTATLMLPVSCADAPAVFVVDDAMNDRLSITTKRMPHYFPDKDVRLYPSIPSSRAAMI